MEIHNKTTHDPVADYNQTDAYMRWALMAAEEVAGKDGLNVTLRSNGLERFINNYPPELTDFTAKATYADYANLNAALLTFFGRGGKGMVIRIGRISAKHAIDQQSALFGIAALLAARILPIPMRLRMVLDRMKDGITKQNAVIGQNLRIMVEDRGDKLAYINYDCPACAGKQSDANICWLFNGVIMEVAHWISGKDFNVEQVECRAKGDERCAWELSKQPKEQ